LRPRAAPVPGASLRVRRWSHATFTFEASAADGDASVGCLGEGGWLGDGGILGGSWIITMDWSFLG